MGFVTKTWKDPVNIDSNNLNRIEQGIKNSHDTLEILEEEVSNLQTKQLDILEQLKTSIPNISSDTILEQLNSILGNTEILTALKNADNFLTKSAQELTKAELNQVYKNLDLDRMLKLTDIRVNDTSVVQGSIASITLPKIDKTLNLNSNNAISNSAVVRAINKLIKDIENNTTFYLKDAIEDDEHMTVSRDEIVRWNSINVDSFLTEELDPTVPAWAKAPTKPIYTYSEIIGTPTIPTDNIELENGRGYITSSEASTIANNLLSTFQTNTINPLSSRVTNLEAMDITITNALNNKAESNHTHSNLASITWVTEEIEDKIAELVGSAPATLDTIQELAAALNNNADIIDTINSTIANKATIKFGNTIQTTVTFDSDPQTQIDNKFDKTGGTITGDINIVNGQGLVLTPASAGSTYYAFKFYAQGDDVFVEKQKVEGGADYQKLLPLDSSLSTTSENAVQNKAITNAIIRRDVAQTLTDTEKQQAQKNITHTATQNYANSGVQVGWYQVANLKTNGNYNIKIKQTYNYNVPDAMQLAISINHRLFTGEPFASITQLSGVNPSAFGLSKIRVRQGTDGGTTFLDVYNPDQLWNTTWVDITSDTQDVVVETNSPFQFIGTEDNPSGYKISSLDLVTGFNTNTPLKSDGNVIVDTRSVNSPPSHYADQQTCYEFKYRDTLGLAEYMPNSDYVVLTTKKGWTGDGYIVYQEAVSAGSDAGAIDDSIVCYRYGRLNSWSEWKTVGTFLPYEFNKQKSFGESGYLYIGKFPIYDTNITVDISCTTSTTYSGKLVIACQNYVVLKASVFGDYSNTVTPNIYYKKVNNTVEVYFKPQAWSKNVIHITGCGIQGEVTHVCEKISAIPSDATSHPENEFGEAGSNSNGYYVKYGDGVLLCWGTKSISSNNQSNIVLPYPFKDTNYVGNANGTRPNYGNEAFIPISTSTYKILGETNSNPFRWQAIGYWK